MNDRKEPIAVSQDEWDEIHECILCSECELLNGCQTEPNFGCQAEEKKRRGGYRGSGGTSGVQGNPVRQPV